MCGVHKLPIFAKTVHKPKQVPRTTVGNISIVYKYVMETVLITATLPSKDIMVFMRSTKMIYEISKNLQSRYLYRKLINFFNVQCLRFICYRKFNIRILIRNISRYNHVLDVMVEFEKIIIAAKKMQIAPVID